MSISIIGAGNMGSALTKAFINQKTISAKNITVCDRSASKLKQLKKDLKIKTSNNNKEALKSDFIVLAVKPQNFDELARQISGKIPAKSIVISIMAGVKIKKIMDALKHSKIIRTMPNTPALVNEGVIGYYSSKNISAKDNKTVKRLLSSAGFSFEVKSESQIDDVTALSGCGPGFFFHIFDQWLKAAHTLNLPKEKTKEILTRTIKGSLKLLESSHDSAYKLTKKVSSKGGATEQGLKVLKKANIQNIFSKMLKAAYNRCKEL